MFQISTNVSIVLDTSQDETNETRDEFEERCITNITQNPKEQFEGLIFFSIKFNEIYALGLFPNFDKKYQQLNLFYIQIFK